MAADLSMLEQWTREYPSSKVVYDKSLWDQPGVQAAMRAAMGKYFLQISQKKPGAPEYPVASDGNGLSAATMRMIAAAIR
jgi:hypothetical protein